MKAKFYSEVEGARMRLWRMRIVEEFTKVTNNLCRKVLGAKDMTSEAVYSAVRTFLKSSVTTACISVLCASTLSFETSAACFDVEGSNFLAISSESEEHEGVITEDNEEVAGIVEDCVMIPANPAPAGPEYVTMPVVTTTVVTTTTTTTTTTVSSDASKATSKTTSTEAATEPATEEEIEYDYEESYDSAYDYSDESESVTESSEETTVTVSSEETVSTSGYYPTEEEFERLCAMVAHESNTTYDGGVTYSTEQPRWTVWTILNRIDSTWGGFANVTSISSAFANDRWLASAWAQPTDQIRAIARQAIDEWAAGGHGIDTNVLFWHSNNCSDGYWRNHFSTSWDGSGYEYTEVY